MTQDGREDVRADVQDCPLDMPPHQSQRESKPHLVSHQVPQESRRELRLQILECARHVSIARRFAGENLGAILPARCRPVKAVVSGGMHLVLGG